jgi:acyl-CoA synthetase (NDP forming)
MSGANGTLAADAADDFGLEFPVFKEETLAGLKKVVPPDQVIRNPADIGFGMTAGMDVRKNSLQAVVSDPSVDALLAIDLAVSNSDYPEVKSTYAELDSGGKPIFLVLQGGKVKQRWLQELEGLNVPIFPTARRAMRVISAMYKFNSKLSS